VKHTCSDEITCSEFLYGIEATWICIYWKCKVTCLGN